MANQIRPLARLFRGMADLIDQDHTSQTRYEAIAKAAGMVAAHGTAPRLHQQVPSLRLWTRIGCPGLALASWTRPMWPSSGRCCQSCAAAR
jgi:hypothetical protein